LWRPKRSDFSVDERIPMIGDDVDIEIDASKRWH